MIDDDSWVAASPAVDNGNLSQWKFKWNSRSVKNGPHNISVKAYNGDWYSIPITIEIVVSNSNSSGGFLGDFDWSLVIIAIVLLLFLNYFQRKKIKK